MKDNNLLFHKQFGFRKSHSTDHALIEPTNNIGGIQLLRYRKMTKIWPPLSPCLDFFDFGNFPSCERSKLYINSQPHPLYKNSKSCNFYIVL